MAPIFGSIIGGVISVIDKLIPDPAEAARMKLELLTRQQAGEFKEIEAAVEIGRQQNAVNAAEASSTDTFRGGWRPAVGWVSAAALAYSFLLRPILPWLVEVFGAGVVPPMPALDMQELMGLLFGMLGLAGYRTIEKLKDKA